MYSILVGDDFGMSRDELMEKLGEKRIGTRTFFIPMHQQPAFLNMRLFEGERYPVAEELAQRGLYLPSSSGLTEEQIEQVCAAISEARR